MGGSDSKAISEGVQRAENGMAGGDKLDLSHQNWPQFPKDLSKFNENEFVALQFFNNRISSFENLVAKNVALASCLVKCQELTVAGNLLKELPEELGLMTSLTSIDVGYNHITTVHKAVFELPNLRELILRNNVLSDLSNITQNGTSKLNKKLEVLDLTGNKLKDIPARLIKELRQLRVLQMGCNLLEVVDGVDLLAYTLEILDLSRNHIMQLPNVPFDYAASIDPDSEIAPQNNALTEKLMELHLQNQTELIEKRTFLEKVFSKEEDEDEYYVLPLSIRFNLYQMTRRASQITVLNLSSLGLVARCFWDPDVVAKMEEDPTFTPEEAPDDCLSYLTNLTELNLSFNKITIFSPSIPKMKRLKVLNLRNNDFQKVEGVQYLTELVELDVQYNELISIPVAITDWRKLSRLMLNDNKLKGVPATLMHCSALRELTLGGNALSQLPEVLGVLELTHFTFHPNLKLHFPPKDVQAQGGQAMLAWMRSRVHHAEMAKIDPAFRVEGLDAPTDPLHVELWGSTDPIGTMQIANTTTLQDLREMINLKLDAAPERYLFVKDNCAIPVDIEHRELALIYTPIIQLHDQSSRHKPNTNQVDEADLLATKELAKVLTLQLRKMKMHNKKEFQPPAPGKAHTFKMPTAMPKSLGGGSNSSRRKTNTSRKK